MSPAANIWQLAFTLRLRRWVSVLFGYANVVLSTKLSKRIKISHQQTPNDGLVQTIVRLRPRDPGKKKTKTQDSKAKQECTSSGKRVTQKCPGAWNQGWEAQDAVLLGLAWGDDSGSSDADGLSRNIFPSRMNLRPMLSLCYTGSIIWNS